MQATDSDDVQIESNPRSGIIARVNGELATFDDELTIINYHGKYKTISCANMLKEELMNGYITIWHKMVFKTQSDVYIAKLLKCDIK